MLIAEAIYERTVLTAEEERQRSIVSASNLKKNIKIKLK